MSQSVTARIASLLVLFCVCTCSAHAQVEEPTRVSVCQLLDDPGRYNHALIEVTGKAERAFENFTLGYTDCTGASRHKAVWLEYGGKESSGTMYCCGVTQDRKRSKPLVVEGITTKLEVDKAFRKFDRIIQKEPSAEAQVTVVGRFFSGEKRKFPAGFFWSGYGHMGFFSLLIIERVVGVESTPLKTP
ncbi:hypothetical protein FHW69_003147 [Luteibacter sp. Sphag1AF]|uniref:hypothetical protein n=1 Tax=Luteibacter sp. Sphag1AF TaxID=2587031 RepID=UPI001614028A|nr:hypothetical protein [Luteibacter sp. Sphag1AF]MBB3228505.1 hypothetical protein [Luteibacter sp. Sphag1AF]